MSATLTNRPLPDIQTRKPTGRPSWPFMLLSAVEGGGKSYAAAEASGSDLIGNTYWIEVGESTADEYGAIPGARYEIVPHDGSYLSVLDAVRWAVAQPRVDGKPNMVVFDSASVLWEMQTDEQQLISNRRAAAKAKQYNKAAPREDQDVTITADQWNVAKDRWVTLVNLLRRHDGPTIMCARLADTMIMNKDGQPTKDRTWKVAGHKSLPYDAQLHVQIREPFPEGQGAGTLVKAQTVHSELNSEQAMGTGWSIDGIWRRLGLADGEVSQSTYVEPDAAAYEAEYDQATVAAAAQAAESETARAAADTGDLPTPDRIIEMIRGSLAEPDVEAQRRKLLLIKSTFGASNLRKIGPIPLSDGSNVDASVAVEKALDIVKGRAGGGEAAAEPADADQAAEPADEAAADPAPVPAKKAAAKKAAAKKTAAKEPTKTAAAAQDEARTKAEAAAPPETPDRQAAAKARVLEEVAFQASVMGTNPGAWTADLSAVEGGQDVRVLAPAKIGKWLVGKRPDVIAALREQGRGGEADRYEAKGDSPIVIVSDLADVSKAA